MPAFIVKMFVQTEQVDDDALDECGHCDPVQVFFDWLDRLVSLAQFLEHALKLMKYLVEVLVGGKDPVDDP
jgi:hypothetical protein